MIGKTVEIDTIINIKELQHRLEGDFILFKDLTAIFMRDSIKLLNSIEESIKSHDMIKLKKYAHTLKGAVSNFSAKRAFDAALALERICTENEFEKVEHAYLELKAEIIKTREALQHLLQKNDF